MDSHILEDIALVFYVIKINSLHEKHYVYYYIYNVLFIFKIRILVIGYFQLSNSKI